MAKSLLAVTLTNHCPKLNNNNVTKVILPIEHTQTIHSVYLVVHNKDVPCDYSARCSTAIEADGFQVSKEMTLADLKAVADMRAVAFHCAMEPGKIPSTYESGKHPSAAVVNAFQILMDGEKVKIKIKSTCHNRKDELYNDVVKLMVQRNLKMHKSSVADEGEYIVQVITNALWCLTNHHLTINDAAKTYRDARNVCAIPRL
ncbi:uncharacterized protein LOC128236679 isoform X2 [Mya arenaria]|uniref:uncharacterized protein LOC128236679 isoform X2 n=1 Tax=Mya arenaria TaxID=6604 RepID=UPI0022DEEF33|nr:uncharacterized protein LOC128236679 isoform X2 [Mya arenaria]XP_052807941.1 uncharacterized protein LOC128236679 isoform X2 [Mya arenaria]